jgi:hypothetical protein
MMKTSQDSSKSLSSVAKRPIKLLKLSRSWLADCHNQTPIRRGHRRKRWMVVRGLLRRSLRQGSIPVPLPQGHLLVRSHQAPKRKTIALPETPEASGSTSPARNFGMLSSIRQWIDACFYTFLISYFLSPCTHLADPCYALFTSCFFLSLPWTLVSKW